MDNGLRLGIFLCDCASTLSQGIDFSPIKAQLAKLPDVGYVSISHGLCLKEAQEAMQKTIKDEGINRVVVAACSPERLENTFRNVLQAAGLNPYLLSMANIREQGVWAQPDKAKAAQKAMTQIGMVVNRARFLEPVAQAQISVNRDVLVIGGGVVGIETAIELSNLNLNTTLMEKGASLGGKLNQLTNLYPFLATSEDVLATKLKQVSARQNIDVLTSAELIDLGGQVGNFRARIRRGQEELERDFGAIVLATGASTQLPAQTHESRLSNNIITQSQFDDMLKSPDKSKQVPQSVCFLLDVADESPRLAVIAALKSASNVKDKFKSEVCVLCQNLKVDGAGLDKLYRDCRDKGVLFIKFNSPPIISQQDGKVEIKVDDALLLGEPVVLFSDLLVLEETSVPPVEAAAMSSALNIGLDAQGFYQQSNVHLYPVASNRAGIFFAGNCHADLDLTRALTEASNAALSAYQLLSQDKITIEVEKMAIDPNKCRFCLTCIRACPHQAIQQVTLDPNRMVAQIVDLACQGCGVCAVVCPAKAINSKDWSDRQILAELSGVYA